jgi:hypothetical protein
LHEQGVNASEILLAEQYFMDRQLLDDRFILFEHICSEEEFFCHQGIFFVSSVKILPEFGNGNVEIEVTTLVENSGNEVNDETVCCIFVSCELDFHGPELNSPADVIVDRNFEPDGVPVGAIEHFKESVFIVLHFGKVFVHNEDVPLHDIGHMVHHQVINLNF